MVAATPVAAAISPGTVSGAFAALRFAPVLIAVLAAAPPLSLGLVLLDASVGG